MKLYSMIHEDQVRVQSEAADLAEVLAEALATLLDQQPDLPVEELKTRILARETAKPSFAAEGACVIHLRDEHVRKFGVCVVIPEKPFPHPADETRKIRIVCLILAPQLQNTMMLQTAAALRRLLASKSARGSLGSIKSAARLIRLVEESGLDVRATLQARDVMEPLTHKVRIDTSLTEALDQLVLARDEGLPVVDENDALVGELTSREILLLGMPRYMDLLSNPEMLNEFEPFENFLRSEATTTVRDICRRDYIAVAPEDQVVQVVHEMVTNNRRRVYVLEDGEIQGIIYRKSIVERVFRH